MPRYELAEAAESDLEAIADYTILIWGVEQQRCYEDHLENHFKAIALQKAKARIFLKHRPELLVSRCKHHYVFHLVRKNECPLILAVLHENMDLINRLRDRLSRPLE